MTEGGVETEKVRIGQGVLGACAIQKHMVMRAVAVTVGNPVIRNAEP